MLKVFNIVRVGGTTAPPNAANHNHTPDSNFKRQNTVDSATIKENTARINSASAAVRPATVKNTPLPGIEPCMSSNDPCKNLKDNFCFSFITVLQLNPHLMYPVFFSYLIFNFSYPKC
jgi:hypothetical protein